MGLPTFQQIQKTEEGKREGEVGGRPGDKIDISLYLSDLPLMSDDPIRSGHINILAMAEVNTLTSLQNLYYILFA